MKIVVIGGWNLNENQKTRLANAGNVNYVEDPGSAEAWLKAVAGSYAIMSDGDHLYGNLYNLKNVFVTYPYIEMGDFDTDKLAANGVQIANAQGGNRPSIVEWTMFMVLCLFRKLNEAMNVTQYEFVRTQSLVDKNVLIIGKGSIGSEVGKRCEAFGMNVDYFKRGDDLAAKIKGKDMFINCLNVNSSSKNLLDEKFFMSLPKGSYYITFVRPWTYDVDGMIKSLDAGILAGAAIDCDPEGLGDTTNDFYQKLLKQNKVLVTPHIAGATVQASANGTEVAVQNIEAFASGKPKNILHKK
jgi:phosphoglycerate dehydrogenase-like enzyme